MTQCGQCTLPWYNKHFIENPTTQWWPNCGTLHFALLQWICVPILIKISVVTLTFDLDNTMWYNALCLDIMNICTKLDQTPIMRTGDMPRTRIDELTSVVTLTFDLDYPMWYTALCLDIMNICTKFDEIPIARTGDMPGERIDELTSVVTLTFDLDDPMWYTALCLDIMNICTKLDQTPFTRTGDMLRTRKRWVNLGSDLDLWPWRPNVVHCTSSWYNEHMYQVWLKSLHANRRYAADKKNELTSVVTLTFDLDDRMWYTALRLDIMNICTKFD